MEDEIGATARTLVDQIDQAAAQVRAAGKVRAKGTRQLLADLLATGADRHCPRADELRAEAERIEKAEALRYYRFKEAVEAALSDFEDPTGQARRDSAAEYARNAMRWEAAGRGL